MPAISDIKTTSSRWCHWLIDVQGTTERVEATVLPTIDGEMPFGLQFESPLLWAYLEPPSLPLPGPPQSTSPQNLTNSTSLQSHALGLAGDVYFSMVQHWNEVTSQSQPVERNLIDDQLLQLLRNLQLGNVLDEIYFPYPTSLHEALQFSLEQYRLALASFVPLESGSASDVLSLA
ncbi:hypothetical protein DAPPUDRAFT_340449 [Daphnia pulex]|nr:hypothetical protein DAPPUDRAFT_340449 [Daphnia pulex]|eukprot:EFX61206.1 hypothetical protein DAPPUDRAFT_340449 [Daphnia pulex]